MTEQDDIHAELGYRTAGRREVWQREWFSLRGDPTEPAPTPKDFKKLVARLRTAAWRKIPGNLDRLKTWRKTEAAMEADRLRNRARYWNSPVARRYRRPHFCKVCRGSGHNARRHKR